ncbi:J domain-containing protein [Leptospira andrefontaineae]|uniref:J domain-containing protein n=1 Tax=Leptospira andrefontaineae TaxID=2484976 RepID=A0A4R9GXG6_9LEPT|nr:J domain-containing protein [Leptospira andrefontaineae]TGK36246.1 J domain-containing protein [Leptospira andrefontaineae]
MIEAYPLTWPEGFKRTKSWERKTSPFLKVKRKNTLSVAVATQKIKDEIRLLRGTNLIISSNIELKKDGLPISGRKPPEDPGVSIWFKINGSQKSLACDSWKSPEENLYALAMTVSSMRVIDRYGCSDMMDRIFTGFLALPAGPSWADVIGVEKDADIETIRKKYHEKVKEVHTDLGGDHNRMVELNLAFEQAKNERKAV